MSGFDPDELAGQLRAAADELNRLSGQMLCAIEDAESRVFVSADQQGLADVTVDGRPRVAELRLHPDVTRAGPDEVDRLLTGLLNDALRQARAATEQTVRSALPGQVRRAVEDATRTERQ